MSGDSVYIGVDFGRRMDSTALAPVYYRPTRSSVDAEGVRTIHELEVLSFGPVLGTGEWRTLRDGLELEREAALSRDVPELVREARRPLGHVSRALAGAMLERAAQELERAVADERVAHVPDRARHAQGGGATTPGGLYADSETPGREKKPLAKSSFLAPTLETVLAQVPNEVPVAGILSATAGPHEAGELTLEGFLAVANRVLRDEL